MRLCLIGMVAALAACGNVKANDSGVDAPPSGATLTSIAVSPSTATLKRVLGAPVQLTATATYSDSSMLDVSSMVTWSSSDTRIAAVSSGGEVSAAASTASGDVTITATLDGESGTAELTVVDPTLVVSSFAASRIDFFPAFANGDVAAIRTIRGAATTLFRPRELAIVGDELFVTDGDAVLVFPVNGEGNIAPVRRIAGSLTSLSQVTGLAVTQNEIFVGTQTNPGRVVVFPRTANGNVMPTREINGANTTLSYVTGLRYANGELYITNDGALVVFPSTASGNVAPARRLAGAMTQFFAPKGAIVVGSELFVSDSGGWISVFPANANGDVAPTRVLTGMLAAPFQAAALGGELLVADNTKDAVQSYALTASDTTPPIRTIAGAMTGLDQCLGVAVY